ncbi:hypothetical protein [Sphaerisporangium dianthi]|uniref:WD40 repeat domain-containing protein n=1 Tax=Sphaerisporangium dianthi TaxID=1436120 RepID=A0ABV9CA64_9ACTN
MTRFHDVLDAIAQEAPPVDLAERTIGAARRRRSRTLASVAAVVLVVGGGGAALVTSGGVAGFDVYRGPGSGSTTGSSVFDGGISVSGVLPARGVGPVRFAYLDWCGLGWKPGFDASTLAPQCAHWRVVTRDGNTYELPDAVGVYTEQTSQSPANNAAPLTVSQDGRRIAYYSEKDEAFVVRDLESGRTWPVPRKLTRSSLVKWGGTVVLSPSGRYAAVSSGPEKPGVLFDTAEGASRPMTAGWWPRNVSDDGDLLSTLNIDQIMVTPLAGEPSQARLPEKLTRWTGALAGDGRTVATFTGGGVENPRAAPGRSGEAPRRPAEEITTFDAASGEVLSSVLLRGAPEGFLPSGPMVWAGEYEVLVGGTAAPSAGAPADAPSTGAPEDADATGAPADADAPARVGVTTYAVDVRTGEVRQIASYWVRGHIARLAIPGM